MPFDPHRARRVALIVLALPFVWFAALWLASDAIWQRLGMSMHAVTFVSIFVAASAAVTALLFGRWARIEDDLLAGRDVIARWQIDAASLAATEAVTRVAEGRDKAALFRIVLRLIALIFGAFAVFDPTAAPVMLAAAVGLAALIWLARRAGEASLAAQAEMRSGEVVVGRHGLRYNGRLHVWGTPLCWLRGAALERSPLSLVVGYAYLTRVGVQSVDVRLPVPAAARDEARRAEAALTALAKARQGP
jgi:hypothetical protein